MGRYTYKSYTWVIGTTTFRQNNLSTKLELALQALDNMRALNKDDPWSSLYSTYMSELKKFDIINYEGTLSEKDARAITSSLVQLGLCTKNRQLTPAGKKLLTITKNNVKLLNDFNLSSFSYFYLLQFLKKREFLFTLYIIIKLDNYLTLDEFKIFVMTLMPNSSLSQIDSVVNNIKNYRSLTSDEQRNNFKDDYIYNTLMALDNFKEVYSDFVTNNILKNDEIKEIGMNRKSSNYDEPLQELYIFLLNLLEEENPNFKSISDFFIENDTISNEWKKIFFSDSKRESEKQSYYLNSFIPYFKSFDSKLNFREWFFKNMHLIKAKGILKDYLDLNKRMLSMTGVIGFLNSKITLTPLFRTVINLNISNIHSILNSESSSNLDNFETFEELYNKKFEFNSDKVFEALSSEFTVEVNKDNVDTILRDHNNKMFEEFIDQTFNEKTLIEIFKEIQNQYSENSPKKIKNSAQKIRKLCNTPDASTPTIFEYLTAISWYYISEKQIRPLESLNLELNADNLPISHASGGQADLLINYDSVSGIEDHNLMLEVTLNKDSNQRRAEMEPVSRHLGEYKINHKDTDTYCIFLTHKLDTNTIVHFRQQKITPYYYKKEWTEESKIIPLDINNLNHILKNKITYSTLYNLFEEAYNSDTDVKSWWEEDINKKITSLK